MDMYDQLLGVGAVTGRLSPPAGGEEAPRESAPLGPNGPVLDLRVLAIEACARYRREFPDEQGRYGDAGNQWCAHDIQHVLNWGVDAVNGDLDIGHEISWLASVLEARGFPIERLARGLDLAADVVVEQVDGSPGSSLAVVLTDTAAFVRGHGSFLGFRV
jgi:hypothetical protein